MIILFLHGWQSTPGGVKPTYLKDHGHTVINPALPDDDFDAAVRIAQAEFDRHYPDVVVGSSRGGAVAMNIESSDTPLVLLCPAWKRWGTATTVKPNTIILHSEQDDVVPFADSEELVTNSGLPLESLIEVGFDHRLADREPLEAMLEACIDAFIPEWTDTADELLQQSWSGLCYVATMRWITVAEEDDWLLVHGTVLCNVSSNRIDHAWCERGDIVVDLTFPVGSQIVERERYYQVFKPEVEKTYSMDEALLLSIKNGHQGPWNKSE